MRFKDKTVIITGGSGGIGLATAKLFAAEGAKIVLVDISQEGLQKASAELNNEHVWTKQCDVSKEDQVIATVNGTIEHFGSIDVIVNNAGLMIFKKIEEQTGDDWLRILSVDLLGAFFFIKQAFLNMKNGGCIVNVSSIHSIETTPMVACYAAAKTALDSLTRSASLEGKPKGIRVNAVLPGSVDTPMLWDNPNVKAGIEVIDPNSVGKPEDIAAVIAFLASDDARFIQGALVRADGGRLNRL